MSISPLLRKTKKIRHYQSSKKCNRLFITYFPRNIIANLFLDFTSFGKHVEFINIEGK